MTAVGPKLSANAQHSDGGHAQVRSGGYILRGLEIVSRILNCAIAILLVAGVLASTALAIRPAYPQVNPVEDAKDALEKRNQVGDVLRRWISKDITFFKDEKNTPRLFVRREPVRIFIRSEVGTAKVALEEAIGLFSHFSGLTLTLTDTNPNVIAMVTSPINDGDRPSKRLFQQLGLPDSALEIVAASGSWASGCGLYTYSGQSGDVALSLIFADKNLPDALLQDCVVDGVIRAFGLRTGANNTIRSSDGYFYYLTLVKALARCDRSIDNSRAGTDRSTIEKRYLDCATEFMKQ